MSAGQSLTTFKFGLGAKNRYFMEISPFYCFFGLYTVQKGLFVQCTDQKNSKMGICP